jgi:hypothetical protein
LYLKDDEIGKDLLQILDKVKEWKQKKYG